jgi:ADP-ribosylglycohydrolase
MQKELIDKIKGVIYGQAIGDALGLGAEFLTKNQVSQFYAGGLRSYDQIIQDGHRSRWEKGEWTDDTEQMICIFDTILSKQSVDVKDIAKNLHLWANNGGRGIGNTIYAVLSDEDFLKDPHKVAHQVWEKSGKTLAANGGVMRTSILGVWDYNDLNKVKNNAEAACKITHADPRCIGSCVAVSLAISLLLQGQTDYDTILNKVQEMTLPYDARLKEYFEIASTETLENLELNQKDSIGYTLKAMAVAFWALKNTDFENGLLRIINEGGDADTNAAIACSVLGAKYGFSSIPTYLVEELKGKDELEAKIQQLIKIMSKNDVSNKPNTSNTTNTISTETQKSGFWQGLVKKIMG